MAKRVHGRELRAAADGTNFPTPLDTALPGASLEGMPCGPGGAKGCGRKIMILTVSVAISDRNIPDGSKSAQARQCSQQPSLAEGSQRTRIPFIIAPGPQKHP
uniref:Uncharacterized protein n=1 Tax=Coccidioides posadasii RMSCC 3488 TaxID=454284 RepID=A0A0J6II03_COCPO|nr:hypothetical protein CPAG_07779 [Coccidioides posadasii RMSCC 3488]